MANSGYILHDNIVDCLNQTSNIDNFKLKTVVPNNLKTCLFPFNTFKETRAHQGDKYNKCVTLKQRDMKGVTPNNQTSYCPIAYEFTKKQQLSIFSPHIEDKVKFIQHFGVCSHTCPGLKAHRVKQSGQYGKVKKCDDLCRWQEPHSGTPFKTVGRYCVMGFDQKSGYKKWGHCICEKEGCYGRAVVTTSTEIPTESQDRISESQDGIATDNSLLTMGIAIPCTVLLVIAVFLLLLYLTKKWRFCPKQPETKSFLRLSEDPDIIKDNTPKQQQYDKMKMIRQLTAQTSSEINPNKVLNDQFHAIPFVLKCEIERSKFKVGAVLGSGNFGTVFKGDASGLFYPKSKTVVAVKTVSTKSNEDDINALVCEMKILSNLDKHCNLVNMLGTCISQLEVNGEIWLLLEFCEKGDSKDFLLKHRDEFTQPAKKGTVINSRLLLTWAYDVAKGMEYLASKNVMHGDLAARNVLISSKKTSKGEVFVAKVADFGLAKQMYESSYYRKQERIYVPWKWMAYEFLEDGKFDRKSDVWSYGVVVWELFSLGKSPYGGQTYDEVFKRLGEGYKLPLPENITNITTWPAQEIYKGLSERCFALPVQTRPSFTEVASFILSYMTERELQIYSEVETQNQATNSLMLLKTQSEAKTLDTRYNAQDKNVSSKRQTMHSF